MTTIEDKIKLFSQTVYDKIQEEKETELEAFDKEKDAIFTEEKRKLSLREKQAMDEAIKKANIKGNELLAKEKLLKQKALLNLRKEILNEILAEVHERVKEYTSSKEYSEYLINSIRDAAAVLENGDYIIYIEEKDIDKNLKEIETILAGYQCKNFELRSCSKELLGGVIIENKNCKFRIDNSLRSKLEHIKPFIGVKLIEKLA